MEKPSGQGGCAVLGVSICSLQIGNTKDAQRVNSSSKAQYNSIALCGGYRTPRTLLSPTSPDQIRTSSVRTGGRMAERYVLKDKCVTLQFSTRAYKVFRFTWYDILIAFLSFWLAVDVIVYVVRAYRSRVSTR